jgi:hypothetical protein
LDSPPFPLQRQSFWCWLRLIRRGPGNLIWLIRILFPLASYSQIKLCNKIVRGSEAPVLWSGKRTDAMVSSENGWPGSGSKFHRTTSIISFNICNKLNLTVTIMQDIVLYEQKEKLFQSSS